MKKSLNTPTIRILIVEPGKRPRTATIPHTLKALQNVVGGYIQAIYPWEDAEAALVCDEEGLLKNYELNRLIDQHTIIAGTFFICGLDEDNFGDLPDDLVERFTRRFCMPEMIVRTPVGYVAVPVEERKEAGVDGSKM